MKRNYFLFIINRALSGIVNGLFYAGSRWLFPVMVIFMGLTLFQLIIDANWHGLTKFQFWMSILGIAASLISIVLLGVSFKFPKFKFNDIHLWTWVNQTAISGTYFFQKYKNWKWLLLAIYPAVFLQKLFINLLSGLRWDYIGTDDVTGKTWGMKIFGRKVKIPRLFRGNMYLRLGLALLSISVFIFLVKPKNKINSNHKIEKLVYA